MNLNPQKRNNMRNCLILYALACFWSLSLQAVSKQDTLHLEEFYSIVLNYHPIALQAGLIAQRGELALSEARGNFDPKLVSSFSNKDFKDVDYYELWDSYLEVPTLLNVDLKAGFEKNQGTYLNPEHNLPDDGLYYAGLSIPLGQGLIHNPRRIALKQAAVTREQLYAQAAQVFNNLLFDANHVYWTWYENYRKFALADRNLQLIRERYQGIRSSVLNGEMAPIDSTEALIQIQQWENALNRSEIALKNSELLMQNFIWTDSVAIEEMLPQTTIDHSSALDMYVNAVSNHPEWQMLLLQNTSLELDQKLKREQLKPVIDLDYQVLLGQSGSSEVGDYMVSNYKAGLRFELPVLLRKERAQLKTVNLKLQENVLKQELEFRKMSNEVRQSYNQVLNLTGMLERQRAMVTNYQRLLDGERMKFDNGESSIFLINSRENSKIKAESDLIEMISRLGTMIGRLKWSAGQFATQGILPPAE